MMTTGDKQIAATLILIVAVFLGLLGIIVWAFG